MLRGNLGVDITVVSFSSPPFLCFDLKTWMKCKALKTLDSSIFSVSKTGAGRIVPL